MKLSYQVLVAIVECGDGEPSDDVEEWVMKEFGELADAERFAEDVHSNNADADAFALANPPPPHKPWSGGPTEQRRQKVLLTGMDCQPGQLDLFETDGETIVSAFTRSSAGACRNTGARVGHSSTNNERKGMT
jgi:hypothetical protein